MSLTKRQKQRIGIVLGFAALTYFASHYPTKSDNTSAAKQPINQLIAQHKSHVQVEVNGTVAHILPDDNKGLRHQRFLIKTHSGQTLLIAYNIDIAPYIKGLKTGNNITVYGEYIWNKKGGLIHWTHHDPQNKHPHGWIRYQGHLYQ